MRIAVIGGTGLIGTRLVARLTADGHDVVAASRATGVNSYTGEGLAEALAGVETLIDVSNSGYLDEAGANQFFYGSTLNLLTYGAAAGVRHHIALSVVAAAVAATAVESPVNRIVEFAGPEQFRLEELVRRQLRARSDLRDVVVDPLVRYFGTDLEERELLPGLGATIAPTRFDDWIAAGGRPAVGVEGVS
jgi:uncharacterized protein YbjT (DUF2867 family)